MKPYRIALFCVYLTVVALWGISSSNHLMAAETLKTALIDGYTLDQWADAIKRAENSEKYPYGIKSVKCEGEAECRQVCKNTVKNTLVKYRESRCKAGEDGLTCLARRYAPSNAPDDPTGLNANWAKNVGFFLERS